MRVKLLLCLFSVYILVLAGIPCRADDDCCIDEMAATAAHQQPTKKSQDYPQPCSPFFACGTCHGFVVPSCEVAIPGQLPNQPVKRAVYKGQPLPDFHASIWQPPQAA